MKKVAILIGLYLAVLFTGCSSNRKAEGMMDDPVTHFEQGKKYFDNGEFVKAQEEFKLAKSLDDEYGPAYAGLGMVAAATGDFDAAEDYISDGIKYCDDTHPIGYIAKGLMIEYQYAGSNEDEWWDDAMDAYKEAMEIAPKDGEPHYRAGYTLKLALQFSMAADEFRKVLELKSGYEAEADSEWAMVQKIQRAAPGSKIGKKVALMEEITRADIAALFIVELEIDRILNKRKAKVYDTEFTAPVDPRTMKTDTVTRMKDIVDIEGHWAKNFIEDLQKFQVRGLEPAPDHKFHPDQKVTRSEYAFFIEDILIAISGDITLATKHIGAATSRFPDVSTGSPYYNAICNAVDKNIIDADISGEFKASESVSGPDALLIIRKIKELRR
ncbi:MAG: S-layer homology domain-containing protein [Fibrobacterales bacterium]